MATFGQWAVTRAIRRVTWVCGPEIVLTQEIVTTARAHAQVTVTLIAGEDREEDIWSAATQLRDPEESTLVVVRSAQRLRHLGSRLPLLARSASEASGLSVLFVSSDDNFPRARNDDGASRDALVPYLAALRDSRYAQLIRCVIPDGVTPDWLLDWASRRLGDAGRVLGARLLEYSGGSLRAAADIAGKLAGARLPATAQNMELLSEPSASFTEAVLAGRTPEALRAAAGLSGPEVGSALGLLGYRVETLRLLHEAHTRGLDGRETSMRLGVPQFAQRRYRELARSYPHPRVASCRRVLALAEDAWRSGVQEGVPELVAVLWGA